MGRKIKALFSSMNSSGFENMSSNFSFNSPSIPRSGQVFMKSRVSKRRSINRPNLRPESQAGPGANPFLQATECPSVIGSSRPMESAFNAAYVGSELNDTTCGLREGVIDEMRNLKIGSEKKPVDAASGVNVKSSFESLAGDQEGSRLAYNEFAALKLQEDMRKLNIEGMDNRPVDKSYPNVRSNANINKGTKLGEGISKINLERELPDDLKKLTIEDYEEHGGSVKVETSAPAPSLKTDPVILTMKNDMGSVQRESRNWSSQWSGVTDNVLSNEVEKKLNLGSESKYSSSKTDHWQFTSDVLQPFTFTRGENVPMKEGTNFTSKSTGVGTPFVEFATPASKVTLVSDIGQKIEFSTKRETINISKLKKKKKKGNLRQSAHVLPRPFVQESVIRGSSFVVKPEASDSYSPMDVSPYQENMVDNRSSREASVTSSESFCLDNSSFRANSEVTGSTKVVDEDLVSATRRMKINSDEDHEVLDEKASMDNLCDESVPVAETESFKTATDEINSIRDDDVTSTEKTEASCSSKLERKGSEGSVQCSFVSQSEETVGGSNFTFGASASISKGQVSALKRNNKKKTSNKGSHFSYSVEIPYASSSSILSYSSACTSPLLSPQLESGSWSPSQHREKDSRLNIRQEVKPKSPSITSAASAAVAAQEACEKWRLRLPVNLMLSTEILISEACL